MAEAVVFARVGDAPLSVDECADAVSSASHGAVVTFAGVIRDHDGGRGVIWLGYEAHPGAAGVLSAVAAEVAARHPGVALAAAHRVGMLHVGDLALVCAAGSAHRASAFAACGELVDEIKARVPIWKEQGFADGSAEWVGALG